MAEEVGVGGGSESTLVVGGKKKGRSSLSAVMAAVVPGRKTRMVLDVTAFVACLVLTMAQLAILDYYFIHYLKDEVWYAWVAGDVAVLGAFIACLVVAVRYNQRCMEEVCSSDANIKYAWLAWLVYSCVLAGKVAVTFRLYHDDISTDLGFTSVDQVFGRHMYKLTLSLTAVIFLLMVESHHYTALASPRQLYLTYLATAVTLDVLDSILFLDLLWDDKVDTHFFPSVSLVFPPLCMPTETRPCRSGEHAPDWRQEEIQRFT